MYNINVCCLFVTERNTVYPQHLGGTGQRAEAAQLQGWLHAGAVVSTVLLEEAKAEPRATRP